jgi:hypothetical protein
MMRTFLFRIFSYLLIYFVSLTSAFSYIDETHFSVTFNTTRSFRVFTPFDYDKSNLSKRYPVIYYFHGCGGSYERSGPYSYQDYGLRAPIALDREDDPAYLYANNADFENLATAKDVIIVCVDGKIDDLPPGCQVYFPSLADSWQGNYYNFSEYIKELIEVVDARYQTKVGPGFRAITGLSMGGHMALWVAATNPDLFSSASQFCHSPNFYDVGEPSYQTTVDVKELWRNFRGVPFRHSTNDRDYLKYYTDQLFAIYAGAGFTNEYYLAENCHHSAARADLQVDFHLKNFSHVIEKVPCFSYLNLYPDFEIRGYQVSSQKTGNGWIYLHDVTKNGLGIYTRRRLPWGRSLPTFALSVTTPANYQPGGEYLISRYSYAEDKFRTEKTKADGLGQLHITSNGGAGEEIGIIGSDLQPPVIVLIDTINENIYLSDQRETALSFEVVNLSMTTQIIDFSVATENADLLTIMTQPERVMIPALSKLAIDSFVVCRGSYPAMLQNVGYLKISSTINGVVQDRQHILQVHVKNKLLNLSSEDIKIFDGQSEDLALFKYAWNGWDSPISTGTISEGSGNGNGIPELGETFSIWVRCPDALDSLDRSTWHPTIPVESKSNQDFVIEKIVHHNQSTGRDLLSALLRLRRNPAKNESVKFTLQTELLKVEPLLNDCHRNTADNFGYFYLDIDLKKDGTFEVKN